MSESKALLVVKVEIDPADDEEFNRWYDVEHMPQKLAEEGFVSGRRFKSFTEPNTYLIVYELENPEAVTSAAYMSQQPTEWGKSVMGRWKSWDRSVWIDLAG
jgi:hypothetical protein